MAIYYPPSMQIGVGGTGGAANNRLVFRETFTELLSSNTVQLSGNITNGTFTAGSWNVNNVLTGLAADVTDLNGDPIYDGSVIFFRNRVQVLSINNSGLVTFDHIPMNGQQFAVWYWYMTAINDKVDNYYREDHVSHMEETDGDFAANVAVNTQNFHGVLTVSDNNTQKAFDRLDVHSHPEIAIVSINGVTNAGGDVKIIGSAGVYIVPDDVNNSVLIGISGVNISGGSGTVGISGASGYSGYSGFTGFSGFSGYSGFSGTSGISGYSGYSGFPTNDALLVHIVGSETISGSKTFNNQTYFPNLQYVSPSGGLTVVSVNISGQLQKTDLPVIREGVLALNTSQKIYTISHALINTATDYPVISLLLPATNSPIYGYAIANRTSTSFDVILSSNPLTNGYMITWVLNSI